MEFLRKSWGQAIKIYEKEHYEKSEVIISIPGGPIVCFTCKDILPRVPEERKEAVKLEHKHSARHIQILSAAQRHSISCNFSIPNWLLFCKICQRSLRFKETVMNHIMDTGHKAWFDEMENLIISESVLVSTSCISIEEFLKSESVFAHCKICDLDIDCTIDRVSEHTSSESHRKQFLQILKPCTGLFPIENNVMWCKVCDLRLNNNVDEVLGHLTESEKHGRWFHDVDNMSYQDISITDFLKHEKEMKATCFRCDLKIKADPKSIIAHVHSEPHWHRYKNYSCGTVKSLADQGIWPAWCHWNFFGHPALVNRNWPA